jgi:Ni,Fe-hydrogenase I small subunit
MNDRFETQRRVRDRELGLQRMRRITRRVTAVAVGGCAVFAGLAATKPIHTKTASATTNGAQARSLRAAKAATTAPTVAAPTTPATAPTFTPVTTSGGS